VHRVLEEFREAFERTVLNNPDNMGTNLGVVGT
jgi:hypothetical protein